MAEEEIVYNILNEGGEGGEPSANIGFELQKTILRMKGEFMREDGSGVDYEGLRNSELYVEYVKKAQQLRNFDLFSLDEEERKVFLLNIYNALTIHGLCVHKPTSVLEIKGFWKNTAYKIGEHIFSLDIIEHALLRCNAIHPSTKKKYLEDGDPRLPLVLKTLDPRIHFALNCGAASCPPIRVFTSKNIERGLTAASINFCTSEIQIEEKEPKTTITLSKILLWYGRDFAENDHKMLSFLVKFLEGEKGERLGKVLEKGEGGYVVEFKDYDWSLNAS